MTRDADAFPAIGSAGAVLLTGLILLLVVEFGPVSAHMAIHIGLMNVAAPIAAVVVLRRFRPVTTRRLPLRLAAAMQIVLLWALHAPSVQALPDGLQVAIHVLLFATAVTFWSLILGLSRTARWRALLPLIVTGKLVCLLGALLIFAPRLLYGHAHGVFGSPSLDDQHLAGLLMVTACPLSYLVAAIVCFARLLDEEPRVRAAA